MCSETDHRGLYHKNSYFNKPLNAVVESLKLIPPQGNGGTEICQRGVIVSFISNANQNLIWSQVAAGGERLLFFVTYFKRLDIKPALGWHYYFFPFPLNWVPSGTE